MNYLRIRPGQPKPPKPQESIRERLFAILGRSFFTLFLMILMLLLAVQFYGRPTTRGRSADNSNIRQISQAAVIYAADNNDRLPVAENVWDYAGKIAKGAGLNSSMIWLSLRGPAQGDNNRISHGVIIDSKDPASLRLSPDFLRLKPAYAVPLFPKAPHLRPTLPVAWTRGLQADGTWPAYAPRHTDGGLIGFADGHVERFKAELDGPAQFTRYEGPGFTHNILEALPPGTRIGQYEPTDTERIQWSNTNRRADWMENWAHKLSPWLIALIWCVFIALSSWLWLLRAVYVIFPLTVAFLAATVIFD